MLKKFEKLKLSLDQVKTFGALFTNLLKAFDCLSHNLIIPKLNTHGFSPSTLKLIQIYLTEKNKGLKTIKLIVIGRKNIFRCAPRIYT